MPTGLIDYTVLKPFASTNLITNPSAETNVTAWTNQSTGGTITQWGANFWRGVRSVRAVMGATGTMTVTYLDTSPSFALLASTYYLFSFNIRLSNGAPITGITVKLDSTTAAIPATITPLGRGFYHCVISKTMAGGAPGDFKIVIGGLSASLTYHFDALYLRTGIAAGLEDTYIDGDEPDCYWLGTPHASQSFRPASTKQGGIIVDLLAYFSNLQQQGGMGMAPIKNVALPMGLLGISQYQRTVKQPRTLNLTGAITVPQSGSLDDLLAKVETIVDLFSPDNTPQPQASILRFDDGITGVIRRINVHRESGPDDYATLTGLTLEPAILKLIAYDPMWYEEGDSGGAPSTFATLAANNIYLRNAAGSWSLPGGGVSGGYVACAAWGPDGNLYIGGSFTLAGGVANTVGIAMWNVATSTWVALGTGTNGGLTQGIAFDQAGNLYISGTFVLVGGVANTVGIAKWNGTAWSALGTGLGGLTSGICLVVDRLGNLYCGGIFTNAGGVANTANIAMWNGSVWSSIGGTGADNAVQALALGTDSLSIFATGTFTTIGGLAAARIARYGGAGVGGWTILGTGLNNSGRALTVLPNGYLVAGGSFTTAGGITASFVAQWNGSFWSPLSTGCSGGTIVPGVYCLTQSTSGLLIAGGDFTIAGGQTLVSAGIAQWNGSAWVQMDANFGANLFYGIAYNKTTGVLAVGTANANAPIIGVVTSLTNLGTANAYPFTISFTGPGTLVELINYTTGDSIFFSNLVVLAGETVTLDLTPGNISFTSNFRGNIINMIARGSNLATWRLIPGVNSISTLMNSVTGATLIKILWKNTHWSIAGGS